MVGTSHGDAGPQPGQLLLSKAGSEATPGPPRKGQMMLQINKSLSNVFFEEKACFPLCLLPPSEKTSETPRSKTPMFICHPKGHLPRCVLSAQRHNWEHHWLLPTAGFLPVRWRRTVGSTHGKQPYHKTTQLHALNVLRHSRSLCAVAITAIYQLAIASTKI